MSSDAKAAVEALELVDGEEDPVTGITAIVPLSDDRRAVYAAGLPDIEGLAEGSGAEVLAVSCESENGPLEHIVVYNEGVAAPVIVTDKIMYDDLPATQIIEYKFAEDGRWLLSCISQSSLEMYRASKFKAWRELLLDGGGKCVVTFRRMLKTGLVTQMYDTMAFPSPAEEASDWKTKDANGKTIDVPRPVYAIRVWDAAEKKHSALGTKLDGAPEPAEEEGYWQKLLVEVKEKIGAEEVESHISAL